MGDVLKAIAAIVLVGAAIKYGAQHLVNKAIAKVGEPGSGYQFEFKPIEIPETNFHWNPNWMSDAGIVVRPDGGAERTRIPTISGGGAVDRSSPADEARQRERMEQVRQMHEAIRNSSDPKREMERIREQMRNSHR
jgi:hypothetical protein